MKNHPSKVYSNWAGMHSADPPDRIEDIRCALLKNMYCDFTGRIVKSKGVSIVTTAAALGLVEDGGRTSVRSLHVYEGQVGENPSARALAVVGGNLMRSQADDLFADWEAVDFPTDIDTPSLDRAAAVAFRGLYAYHQNGLDFPFRIKCEEDDPTTSLTNDAEVLGLKPPAACMFQSGSTSGTAKRFAANSPTTYCITFVYGDRGESGAGVLLSWAVIPPTATVDELDFENIPLGGTGCTARRIYRSAIGRGKNPIGGSSAQKDIVAWIERGVDVEMGLIAEIADNTTTTWTDKFDNSAIDFATPPPQRRPFPPIAQYQIMHLDKLFWAKLRDHPWVLGALYDQSRTDIAPAAYTVSISNSGAGTITFKDDGSTDFTISSYKTKTLREIMIAMLSAATNPPTTAITDKYTGTGVCPVPAGGIDLDRTYTFKEVTDQSIFSTAYWFTAIDDDTTQGLQWHPNGVAWSDEVFPEQVSYRNSVLLTRFGSKRITGEILMDNTPIITTDTDCFALPGSFIPDNDGIPAFEVHRSQASHGSICPNPNAMTSVPGVGIAMIAHDDLRAFRGDSSILWAPEIRNWFSRIQREPVTRDFLTTAYHKGEVFIALATDETS